MSAALNSFPAFGSYRDGTAGIFAGIVLLPVGLALALVTLGLSSAGAFRRGTVAYWYRLVACLAALAPLLVLGGGTSDPLSSIILLTIGGSFLWLIFKLTHNGASSVDKSRRD